MKIKRTSIEHNLCDWLHCNAYADWRIEPNDDERKLLKRKRVLLEDSEIWNMNYLIFCSKHMIKIAQRLKDTELYSVIGWDMI